MVNDETNPPLTNLPQQPIETFIFIFTNHPCSFYVPKFTPLSGRLLSIEVSSFSRKNLTFVQMGEEGKVYTLAEVSEHNDRKDCWLIVEGKVSLS